MPDFDLTGVDSKQIENTAAGIDDNIAELLSICSVIENEVTENLNPYWQGQARQNFEQQFILFAANLSKLINEYRELNEQLKKAGKTYVNADERAGNIIAGLPK